MATTVPPSGKRSPGRPRRTATEEAITAAAREVLTEQGLPGLSMEQVARRAGVAKTTLYRRWPSKVELAVDAVAATFDTVEVADHGSLPEDVRAGVGEAARLLREPSVAGAYAALLAESARDPDGVGERVRQALGGRLRRVVAAPVDRAVARGEVDAQSVDVDLLGDVVVGAVLHRALVTGAPDAVFVGALTDLLSDLALGRSLRASGQATARADAPANGAAPATGQKRAGSR